MTVMAGDTARTRFDGYHVDEFVYVINGQATLTTQDGIAQTFYSGDFFVVPEGFAGTWETDGNHLYRELIVLPGKKQV